MDTDRTDREGRIMQGTKIRWAEHTALPYEISTDGQVRSTAGRPIKAHRTADGYLRVRLLRPTPANHLVHRLVLEAHHGPCPDGHEALHLNDRRDDNRADNLAWGTRQQNVRQRDAHGRTARGDRIPQTRLVPDDVSEIRRLIADGHSQREVAGRFGVSRGAIRSILAGQSWRWVR